jgi:hypothetical protein
MAYIYKLILVFINKPKLAGIPNLESSRKSFSAVYPALYNGIDLSFRF